MQPLISFDSLQEILERGLVTGKWSISQFNRQDYWTETAVKNKQMILPRSGFLRDHPQFLDKEFRDVEAFKSAAHRSAF
jgi:hypothetical protein